MKPCLSLAIVTLSTFIGCSTQQDEYAISMRVDGDKLHRSITAKFEDDGELQRVAKLYDDNLKSAGEETKTYRGQFGARMPNDVGGHGTYTHWKTQLGTCGAYVERFRGDDDLHSQLKKRQDAANELVDIVKGWLKSELGKDVKFAKFERFLEKQFRRDVQNLVHYAWVAAVSDELGHPTPSEDSDQSATIAEHLVIRIGQYLVERDYFSPETLPKIMRSFESSSSEQGLQTLSDFIARKMALEDAKRGEILKFLSDSRRAEASLVAYLQKSAVFQERLKQWRIELAKDPDADEPDPKVLMSDLASTMLGLQFGVSYSTVNATLECPIKPYITNGSWSAKEKRVAWSADIGTDAENRLHLLPTVNFAFWAVPNDDFQKKTFGKVILQDEELSQYVLWYRALSKIEAKEWDRLLGTLAAEEGRMTRLEEFRFSTDPIPPPPENADKPSLADTARYLIMQGLEEDEPEE